MKFQGANPYFQFSGSLLGGGQPFPLLGYVGGLLGGLRFLDGADKLGPVIPGILRDGPEHIGNQGQNSFGLDTVLCRAIQKALRQYKNPPIPTKQDQIVVPNNSVLVLVKAG